MYALTKYNSWHLTILARVQNVSPKIGAIILFLKWKKNAVVF
jgi:hypothetical protein